MKDVAMVKRFRLLGILTLILLLWFSWQSVTLAQSTTQVESRLSRIELENATLRSRVNQLESQVSRLSANAGIDFSQSVPIDRSAPATSPLAEDPTFKRLATLVIELKERVVAVEDQVAAIAPSRSPHQ